MIQVNVWHRSPNTKLWSYSWIGGPRPFPWSWMESVWGFIIFIPFLKSDQNIFIKWQQKKVGYFHDIPKIWSKHFHPSEYFHQNHPIPKFASDSIFFLNSTGANMGPKKLGPNFMIILDWLVWVDAQYAHWWVFPLTSSYQVLTRQAIMPTYNAYLE